VWPRRWCRSRLVAIPMAAFVLVPGAWLGGWCWRDVAESLRAQGHLAIATTLTGLGERAHLLRPDTGLDTHVDDVVALVRDRDLNDVVLVGHSYGGTVITAVAERLPQQIRSLVYLDGSVPQDGQSNNDVLGPMRAEQIRQDALSRGDGWRVPPGSTAGWGLSASMRAWVEPRLTAHPLRSLDDRVRLQSKAAASLPRAFLRTSTQSAFYARLMEQARGAGWHCRDIGGGHYPMFTNAEAVAAALTAVAAPSA
jgi:pimeloyl-ACP methyl ester carboxylesterase